jgi:hypothetical protein
MTSVSDLVLGIMVTAELIAIVLMVVGSIGFIFWGVWTLLRMVFPVWFAAFTVLFLLANAVLALILCTSKPDDYEMTYLDWAY